MSTPIDPQLIKAMAIAIAPTHCRLIVSESDSSFHIYGQTSDAPNLLDDLIKKIILTHPDFSNLSLSDQGKEELFHHFQMSNRNQVQIDIYFFQTEESPYDEKYVLVKKDGTLTDVQKFNTIIVNRDEVIFEATNPK